MSYLLAGLIGPFFWWIVLSLCLWFVRTFCPKWEKVLFRKF